MGFNLVSTSSIQVICLICLYANVAQINVMNIDHRSFSCMNENCQVMLHVDSISTMTFVQFSGEFTGINQRLRKIDGIKL